MSGDDMAGLLWGAGALVLVGSAVVARQMPWGQTARLALAWAAIILVVTGVVGALGG